jgi:prepilin-type N-terminal cleavage/methylation domain-containing protein
MRSSYVAIFLLVILRKSKNSGSENPDTKWSSRCLLQPAFTLVELLVVIVIIGLLAGLSVPVIGRALDSAADAEDLSKLKQIGTGISIFENENGGRLPCSDMNALGAGYGNFMEMVNRSFPPDSKFNAGGNYNWLMNPVWYSKRAAKMPAGQSYDPKKNYYWGVAWGMNDFLYYGSGGMGALDGYIIRAPNRTRLVLVGEKNRNGGNTVLFQSNPVFKNNVQTEYRISRPGSNALYLFADYHVEKIAGDQSIMARPEYGSYSPNVRMYYKW